jgi:hypothetical protein
MLATPGAFGRQALGRLRRDLLLAASAQAAP